MCASWPGEDLGDGFRTPLVSNVPVLFISGTLDIKTPPSNAEEMRKGLPNSHHLIIDGASHDDDLFLSTPVIRRTMLAFLRRESALPSRVALDPLKFKRPWVIPMHRFTAVLGLRSDLDTLRLHLRDPRQTA
jgi:hypothetical protein